MNQKVAVRIVVGLFAIAVLSAGWFWFAEWSKDPENEAQAKTGGMIAAIEVVADGSRAVVFDSSGKKIESPAPAKGKEDREISWGPTGAHVFISSNRQLEAFNIYRWNPERGSLDKRSRGTRSQGAPWFIPDGSVESLRNGLFVAGGAVQVLDPKLLSQSQILPPLERTVDQEEGGGSVGPMSGVYKDIGTSFKDARWGPGRQVVYSVMRRDGGEIFVMSALTPDPSSGRVPPPVFPLAGSKVQIDADKTGKCVVVIEDFQFPDPNNIPAKSIKDGKVVTDFRDGIFLVAPPGSAAAQQGLAPIVIFPKTDPTYASEVALSPDGSKVAVVLKRRKGEESESVGLFVFPAEPGGGSKGGGVVQGNVTSPNWSPDGTKIVYLKIDSSNKRSINTVDLANGTDKMVSDALGDYRSPKFSPSP